MSHLRQFLGRAGGCPWPKLDRWSRPTWSSSRRPRRRWAGCTSPRRRRRRRPLSPEAFWVQCHSSILLVAEFNDGQWWWLKWQKIGNQNQRTRVHFPLVFSSFDSSVLQKLIWKCGVTKKKEDKLRNEGLNWNEPIELVCNINCLLVLWVRHWGRQREVSRSFFRLWMTGRDWHADVQCTQLIKVHR